MSPAAVMTSRSAASTRCSAVEADGAFYRILDDSGDDFLYPASHFKPSLRPLIAVESAAR
jgi:hypothetical protein